MLPDKLWSGQRRPHSTMMELLKRRASTALVCVAAIAVALPGEGQAASLSAADATDPGRQQVNGTARIGSTQTRPFQWSTFGVFPSGAALANVQLNPPVVTNPIQPLAATNSERLKRQTANKKKQQNKNKRTKAAIGECLEAHNKMRRLHKVPELQWDEKLAAFAQKRSNHIAASDGKEFGHPPDLPFGENLFWHSSLDTSCEYMVKGWYDEIDLYDFKAPTFAPATGHFTQMIWRTTQKIGCAFATSSGPRGGLYLTCNYDPPGNWVGEFEENVPLPVTVASRVPAATTSPATTTTTTTTSTTTTTTARPVTTLASSTAAPPLDKSAETTKPKSKKKKKKKKSSKKKSDKEKAKKKSKKKRGGKKKTTASTTQPPLAGSNTTKAPGS